MATGEAEVAYGTDTAGAIVKLAGGQPQAPAR